MADDIFKLPGSSYDTVVKVIKAYAEVGDKTSLATISRIMGSDPTVASRNIAFLLSVGLLEGGRDKGPTAQGKKLGRALTFEEQTDMAASWREVLAPHPLIQRIVAAIRVRGGMDAATLQSQIVYTAGVKKSGSAMTGGGAVLEMMKAAGLVAERDGKLIAASPVEIAAATAASDESLDDVATPVATVQRVVEQRVSAGGTVVNVNLDIRVEATVADLNTLGETLRVLIAHIQAEAPDSNGFEPAADE